MKNQKTKQTNRQRTNRQRTKTVKTRKERIKNNAPKDAMRIVLTVLLVVSLIAVAALDGIWIAQKVNARMQQKRRAASEATAVSTETTQQAQSTTEAIEPTTATLSFVGDIICHKQQFYDAYNYETGKYDFSKCLASVTPYLKKADLAIGNLETVFAGKERGYSGFPAFNAPDGLAKSLKKAGFDVLTTANNHCYDQGVYGIKRTLDVLDDFGISHMGTYRNEKEKKNIVVKEVNGIKIAFISFTSFINQGKNIGTKNINYLTEKEMKKQMRLAKAQKPDCIVVMPHWGEEYETVPNEKQRDIAQKFLDYGATIVVGSHSHVIQKMTRKKVTNKNGEERKVVVAYSLGNFISNQNSAYTRDTAILNIKLKKDEKGTRLAKVDYRPLYMDKIGGGGSGTRAFKLIDIKSYKKKYKEDPSKVNPYLYDTVINAERNIKRLLKG